MFLKWLNFIGEKLNQAIITDANGNISFNGATIPEGLNTAYNYEFYPKGVVKMYGNFGGTDRFFYTSTNTYYKATNLWTLIDSGTDAWIEFYGPNISRRSFVSSGTADANFLTAPQLIYEQDSSGNVNIKTGATYTSTL